MSPSPRIFVSYERQDGMQAAKELRQRLEDRGFTLWQDLIALEGGLEWWAQIEQAIKSPSIEHLVLVVTPGALERPVIKKELRLARQEGRQVSPVWAGKQFEMKVYTEKTHAVTGAVRKQMLEGLTEFLERNLK